MKFNSRFQVENSIGDGGFGEVWKAYDPQSQQYVALKKAVPHDMSSFKREIKVLDKLSQKNLEGTLILNIFLGFPKLIYFNESMTYYA